MEVDESVLAGPPLGRDPRLWPALVANARPSLRLAAGPGRSWLGGEPVTAPGFAWPHTPDGRPLTFLAGIVIDELFGGTALNVFYDLDGFEPVWHLHLAPAPDGPPATGRPHGVTRVLTVPERWEAPVHALWQAGPADASQVYRRLARRTADGPVHRVLGWSDPLQGPMHEDGWTLLLQLDSDPATGFTFGDEGTVYFWIPDEDLRAAELSRVRAVVQSH
ncbi:DUF1963 domain-containing protein [Dactylosporangium sp. NPDC051541]|uniref:DUF1963 domain-containing protein n=1 Tax=Dactylosporangium sp. NPDC051541 TaxID=3363977 RepID=UPI00378C324B